MLLSGCYLSEDQLDSPGKNSKLHIRPMLCSEVAVIRTLPFGLTAQTAPISVITRIFAMAKMAVISTSTVVLAMALLLELY